MWAGVLWGGGRTRISTGLGLITRRDMCARMLGDGMRCIRGLTLYVNVENALDRRYNEVVGYPALPVNFRAGVRFRIGGE